MVKIVKCGYCKEEQERRIPKASSSPIVKDNIACIKCGNYFSHKELE